ncbi:MAG: hypothetical protein H6679_00745 [Epsilonproteobacteria bacterium]|nr:hypothetical protein [Campylobacterota bacterium]
MKETVKQCLRALGCMLLFLLPQHAHADFRVKDIAKIVSLLKAPIIIYRHMSKADKKIAPRIHLYNKMTVDAMRIIHQSAVFYSWFTQKKHTVYDEHPVLRASWLCYDSFMLYDDLIELITNDDEQTYDPALELIDEQEHYAITDFLTTYCLPILESAGSVLHEHLDIGKGRLICQDLEYFSRAVSEFCQCSSSQRAKKLLLALALAHLSLLIKDCYTIAHPEQDEPPYEQKPEHKYIAKSHLQQARELLNRTDSVFELIDQGRAFYQNTLTTGEKGSLLENIIMHIVLPNLEAHTSDSSFNRFIGGAQIGAHVARKLAGTIMQNIKETIADGKEKKAEDSDSATAITNQTLVKRLNPETMQKLGYTIISLQADKRDELLSLFNSNYTNASNHIIARDVERILAILNISFDHVKKDIHAVLDKLEHQRLQEKQA